MINAKLSAVRLRRSVQRVRGALADQTKSMSEVARTLEQYVRNTFRDQTDPWGVPWAEWSAVTAQGRIRAEDFSTQKLIQSGALFGSINAFATSQSATVQAGDGIPYANVHQFGNPANLAWGGGAAPIPARPFFPMRSENEAAFPDAWLDAVFAPIEAALKEAVNE